MPVCCCIVRRSICGSTALVTSTRPEGFACEKRAASRLLQGAQLHAAVGCRGERPGQCRRGLASAMLQHLAQHLQQHSCGSEHEAGARQLTGLSCTEEARDDPH